MSILSGITHEGVRFSQEIGRAHIIGPTCEWFKKQQTQVVVS